MTDRRAPRAVVAKDFDDAIDRLVAGKPSDRRLKRLAAENRLKINPTTVAREAKRSRSLIAHAKCAYQEQRARVVALQNPEDVAAPRTASAVITKLKGDLAELKSQLQVSREAQAEHFLARERAQRDRDRALAEADRWRDEAKRVAAQYDGITHLRTVGSSERKSGD